MDETVSHTTLTLHIACLLCLIPAAHPHISNTLPHSRLTLSLQHILLQASCYRLAHTCL